jgi:hypothetical protein
VRPRTSELLADEDWSLVEDVVGMFETCLGF